MIRPIGAIVRRPFNKAVTRLFVAALMLAGLPQAHAEERLRIYYVRHAEGGHNVAKEWSKRPKSERPPYVGNPDVFTPKGEQQVTALTSKLEGMTFDFIAVSPTWRTRNTILPYLKTSGKKAEIWPELTENTGVPADRLAESDKLPQPRADLCGGGDPILLPEAERPFFTFRDDGTREVKSVAENADQKTADNLALARKTISMIKARFSKSGKSILLVGHGTAGATLLRVLTHELPELRSLHNTGIWMAEEQPDGSFKLKMLNSEPYCGGRALPAFAAWAK